MKPIAVLAALAALLCADAASAAVTHVRFARHGIARPHRASRGSHRHRIRIRTLTPSVSPGVARTARLYRTDDEAGAPSSPGLYKSEKDREAGWGFKQGGMHTVVGLYQRPAEAGDVPGPQTYHTPEGRGAAGLSLSFKLGQ